MRTIGLTIGMLGMLLTPTLACDFSFPADYVPPSTEHEVAYARHAFIGTVIGFRDDSGAFIAPGPGCSGWGWEGEGCKPLGGQVVSAILTVDTPIKGIDQHLFESYQGGDGECRYVYLQDHTYLVRDDSPEPLAHTPSAEEIARWRIAVP